MCPKPTFVLRDHCNFKFAKIIIIIVYLPIVVHIVLRALGRRAGRVVTPVNVVECVVVLASVEGMCILRQVEMRGQHVLRHFLVHVEASKTPPQRVARLFQILRQRLMSQQFL